MEPFKILLRQVVTKLGMLFFDDLCTVQIMRKLEFMFLGLHLKCNYSIEYFVGYFLQLKFTDYFVFYLQSDFYKVFFVHLQSQATRGGSMTL